MKFFLRIILIAVGTYLLGIFFPIPWWLNATIPALLVAFLFGRKPQRRVYGRRHVHRPGSFWSGFIGVGAVWGVVAYLLGSENHFSLADRIYELFLQSPNPSGGIFLALITAILAGIIGGLSSLTGQKLGEAVK